MGYSLYEKFKKEHEPQNEVALPTDNQIPRPTQTNRDSNTTGVLKEVGANGFTLNFLAPNGAMIEKSFTVAPDAKILLDDKPVPLDKLKIHRNITCPLNETNEVVRVVQTSTPPPFFKK